MKRERSKTESSDKSRGDSGRRKEALKVLIDARERLLAQMMEDILERREALALNAGDGYSSFELEEIEDRYTARLQAINSLLENLEYRYPVVRYEVETFLSTLRNLKQDLADMFAQFEEWDLVSMNVVPMKGEEVFVVLTFTADEYPEP